MRRPTKAERAAAAAVLGMAAAVAVSGVKLLNRYSKYMMKKAAAAFGEDEASDDEPAEGNDHPVNADTAENDTNTDTVKRAPVWTDDVVWESEHKEEK